MTTYLHYIRALKSGVVINDYNYSPMLERLLSLRHVKCFMVLPNTGLGYREYSYEPPVVTVQETLTVADAHADNAAVAPLYPLSPYFELHHSTRFCYELHPDKWTAPVYPNAGYVKRIGDTLYIKVKFGSTMFHWLRYGRTNAYTHVIGQSAYLDSLDALNAVEQAA